MVSGTCTGCVLIVEDDAEIREPLREHIESLGCTVLVATDGVDALEFLAERVPVRPCLIITDLNMPRLDGAALAHRVRDGASDAIPVVTMSAEPDRLPPPGVEAHLAKPFPLDDLERIVGRLCPSRRCGPVRSEALPV